MLPGPELDITEFDDKAEMPQPTIDSMLEWLSDSSVHQREKVISFQWNYLPTLLTTHIQSQQGQPHQHNDQLLLQLLEELVSFLKKCFDSHTLIPNKRLLHSSLSHLAQSPSSDPLTKRGVVQCLASLEIVDEGPFAVVETSQLDQMESKDRTIAQQQASFSNLQLQYDRLKATFEEAKGMMTQLEMEKAEWTEKRKTHLSTIQSLQREKEQIQRECERLRGESETRLIEMQRTMENIGDGLDAHFGRLGAKDCIDAFSPEHIRVNGSSVTRINSERHVGCFTKPVSRGIHRMSITTEMRFVIDLAASFHSNSVVLLGCKYDSMNRLFVEVIFYWNWPTPHFYSKECRSDRIIAMVSGSHALPERDTEQNQPNSKRFLVARAKCLPASYTTSSYKHFSVASDIGAITGKAVFRYCTVKNLEGAFRGAINQQSTSTASATLDISWCSFQSCSTTGPGWSGAVRQGVSSSNNFFMTHSVFKNTYVQHGGGICIDTSSSQTISQCIFSDCSGMQHSGAVFSNLWDATTTNTRYSNIFFQNCAQLAEIGSFGGGALLFYIPQSINLEYLQFRNCSAASGKGSDFHIDNAASGGTQRMYLLDSTSTGTHVYYSSMSPLPSPHQLPSPSPSISLVSISGKATDQWTVELTMEASTTITGALLALADNSATITFEVEFTTSKNGVSEPTLLSITGENKKLSPDTTYEIRSITRKSDGLIVLFHPASITISVPKRSCLTTLDSTPVYSDLDKQVSVWLEGSKLVGTHTISFSVNGSSDSAFVRSVVFDSDGKGSLSGILFDADSSKLELHYNTRYDVIGVTKNGFEVDFETGLSFTTMKEPMRLMGVGEPVDKNDQNVTTISLTGHAALEGSYELDLENSEDSTEKVTIVASFTATDAGEAQATLYPTRQLKYGETYKVTGLRGTMSSPPKIHVEAGLTVSIAPEQSRLTFMDSASPQNKQKEVSMALTGIKMTNGPFTIALNGSKTIRASFAADGVTGSSTVILFSTTASEAEVEYGQTYSVLGVTDKDDNEVFFHSGLSFLTPPEPTRLVSFSIVEYDSLKKNVLVTMDGIQLDVSSKYEVDLFRMSWTEHTLTMEWNPSSLRWEGLASLFPLYNAVILFGEIYSIVEFRKQSISTPLFFESNSIEIIPEPPRLVSIFNVHFNDIVTVAKLFLDSTQLVTGTVYQLTFSETPYSFSNADETSQVQIDVTATETGMMSIELDLYPSSTAILKYSHFYNVTSVTEKTQSTPVLFEKTDCVFVTPMEPTRIESGSATLNSQRDTATIVVTGRELHIGEYSIVIESGPDLASFNSFKSVRLYGPDVFVNSDASVWIPLPPLVTNASFTFSAGSNRKGTVKLTGTDLPTSSSYIVTTTPAASIILTFSSSTSGTSTDLSLGNNGVMDFSTVYTLTSIVRVGDPSDVIRTSGVVSFTTGKKPRQLQVIVKEGGHSDTLDCGEYANPCDTIANGWKRREAEGVEQEHVTLQIDTVASFGACISIKRESLPIAGLHSSTPRVVVDDTLSCTSTAQRGVVWVDTGHLQLESLVLELQSFSQSISSVQPLYVVMGRGTFSCDSVTIANQHGERVGIGLASLSEGQIDLTRFSVKNLVFSDNVALLATESGSNPITFSLQHSLFRNVSTTNHPLFVLTSQSAFSSFSLADSSFISTNRVQHVLSEQHTPLLVISQAHSSFEISNCVFERSGCVDRHNTFISPVLHLTHTASSTSLRFSVLLSSCLFVDSFPSSTHLTAAIVISTTKTPSSVSFPHSWFESTTSSSPPFARNRDGVPLMNWKRKVTFPSSSSPIAVLVERGALLPAVSRTGSVFSNTQLKVSATNTRKPSPDLPV
ncbi:hypothetical protein BLNAU_17019 [Blattamonas nauphoetae]|uniref:Uncharacterized protein n=1 Tax=Blattamonas nauphoetae TaxID=2049346 RepID=A0ABQ9XBN9_9EUKA|nr:hypothetical protein BLNAU_17019 [Blattamonas nauphoetae]